LKLLLFKKQYALKQKENAQKKGD